MNQCCDVHKNMVFSCHFHRVYVSLCRGVHSTETDYPGAAVAMNQPPKLHSRGTRVSSVNLSWRRVPAVCSLPRCFSYPLSRSCGEIREMLCLLIFIRRMSFTQILASFFPSTDSSMYCGTFEFASRRPRVPRRTHSGMLGSKLYTALTSTVDQIISFPPQYVRYIFR